MSLFYLPPVDSQVKKFFIHDACAQVLNKLDEFEEAVRKAVRDVRLDNDVVVSVFETNIRVLGYKTCLTCSPYKLNICRHVVV